MLKKITEPQAQYSKTHTGADAVTATPMSSSFTPQRSNKMKMKVVGSVVATALFLVVGIAGVMTAIRQQKVAGPVAPNAPASIPRAAGNNVCSLTFTVGDTPVVTPNACGATCNSGQPCATGLICMPNSAVYGGSGICTTDAFKDRCATATDGSNAQVLCCQAPPVAAVVNCAQKLAYAVKSDGSPVLLQQHAIVATDDIIQYNIVLTASAMTAGPVTVVDKLDGGTTWLSANDVAGVSIKADATTGTVTATVQPFTGTKTFAYRVKVGKFTRAFSIDNIATITNDGSGKAVADRCANNLVTAPVGTAVCEGKTAYTLDASENVVPITDKTGTIKPDTEFFYKIKVVAKSQTTGSVTVTDTLPAGIQFISGVQPSDISAAPPTAAGKTVVTANLGTIGDKATLDQAEEEYVVFKAKVLGTVEPGKLVNTVVVTTGTNPTPSTCEHTAVVPPEGVAQCVTKEMHNAPMSENKADSATRIAENSKIDDQTEFYYRLKISADKLTTGAITVTDILPSSLDIVSATGFTNTNGTLTQTIPAMKGDKVVEFKVKVKSGVQGKITNTATVTTAGTTASTDSCEANFEVPSYTCNSTCVSDSQCQKVNSEYRCTNIDGSMKCRLGSNTVSTSCSSTTPTPTPTPGPSATPTIGCNDRCTTNADCTNPSHICYQTTDGGHCRLDDYVTSATCTRPGVATATPTAQQPNLPQQLPVTGPAEWANWLKAGMVTLGIGAVLLLLL